MDVSKIKVIALDLDGTLTQHKQKMNEQNKAALKKLGQKYKLLMVGAGQVMRIFNQLDKFPVDVIGNYGMQYGKYNAKTGEIDMIKDNCFPYDKELIDKKVTNMRIKFGFTEFKGKNVEFHPSGCVTFPILGTDAVLEDKLKFDPDRSKRRKIYAQIQKEFSDYNVFVGGSSSFDMAPKPYDKYYALDLFCQENGYTHAEIVFIGDDYGLGGNDESVYKSDFNFIKIDDYLTFPEKVKQLIER